MMIPEFDLIIDEVRGLLEQIPDSAMSKALETICRHHTFEDRQRRGFEPGVKTELPLGTLFGFEFGMKFRQDELDGFVRPEADGGELGGDGFAVGSEDSEFVDAVKTPAGEGKAVSDKSCTRNATFLQKLKGDPGIAQFALFFVDRILDRHGRRQGPFYP